MTKSSHPNKPDPLSQSSQSSSAVLTTFQNPDPKTSQQISLTAPLPRSCFTTWNEPTSSEDTGESLQVPTPLQSGSSSLLSQHHNETSTSAERQMEPQLQPSPAPGLPMPQLGHMFSTPQTKLSPYLSRLAARLLLLTFLALLMEVSFYLGLCKKLDLELAWPLIGHCHQIPWAARGCNRPVGSGEGPAVMTGLIRACLCREALLSPH